MSYQIHLRLFHERMNVVSTISSFEVFATSFDHGSMMEEAMEIASIQDDICASVVPRSFFLNNLTPFSNVKNDVLH